MLGDSHFTACARKTTKRHTHAARNSLDVDEHDVSMIIFPKDLSRLAYVLPALPADLRTFHRHYLELRRTRLQEVLFMTDIPTNLQPSL